MTDKYTYEANITIRGVDKKQVLTVFVDAGEITDFTLHYDTNGYIENITDLDDLGNYFEYISYSTPHDDLDRSKRLWRYEGNNTIAGVYHVPTDTFIGISGIYDSWNGTNYYAKIATKLKTVEVYRPCELRNLPRANP
ncbi:hypothetical protein phiOC_p169 [Ochrobactrum phage vB_OspM_OC]|nr:hypothetical protein phiOC_p169 [Ochrobactrum phage vB_OspM_OC]